MALAQQNVVGLLELLKSNAGLLGRQLCGVGMQGLGLAPKASPAAPPQSQPRPDAWQGIGQRRPLSGGEWFSLVLLSVALLLSLVLGLGVALAQGRDWQVSPSWLADEQTQDTSVRSQPDGLPAPGEHPAESALSPGA